MGMVSTVILIDINKNALDRHGYHGKTRTLSDHRRGYPAHSSGQLEIAASTAGNRRLPAGVLAPHAADSDTEHELCGFPVDLTALADGSRGGGALNRVRQNQQHKVFKAYVTKVCNIINKLHHCTSLYQNKENVECGVLYVTDFICAEMAPPRRVQLQICKVLSRHPRQHKIAHCSNWHILVHLHI